MITTEGKSTSEILTEVMEKLIAQGGRCLQGNGCAYGDGEGNHCSVGWLLPSDNEVLMSYDGDIDGLLINYSDVGPNDKWIRTHSEVLEHLQDFHDHATLSSDLTLRGKKLLPYVDQSLLKKWQQMTTGG